MLEGARRGAYRKSQASFGKTIERGREEQGRAGKVREEQGKGREGREEQGRAGKSRNVLGAAGSAGRFWEELEMQGGAVRRREVPGSLQIGLGEYQSGLERCREH